MWFINRKYWPSGNIKTGRLSGFVAWSFNLKGQNIKTSILRLPSITSVISIKKIEDSVNIWSNSIYYCFNQHPYILFCYCFPIFCIWSLEPNMCFSSRECSLHNTKKSFLNLSHLQIQFIKITHFLQYVHFKYHNK